MEAIFPMYSNTILYGSSQAGKSTWLRKLIENQERLFPTPADCLIYIYKDDTGLDKINLNPQCKLYKLKSFPSKEELLCMTSPHKHTILIVDDCLTLGINPIFIDLFTIYSHHQKIQ